MDVRSRRESHGRYKFGDFVLDVAERDLVRGAEHIHLAPKTFAVLVVLVTRAGRLVTKREILDRVWPTVFVEEGILTVHVAQLRKVLGEVKGARRYIQTVSGSGYRFRAAVQRVAEQDPDAALTQGRTRTAHPTTENDVIAPSKMARRRVGPAETAEPAWQE